METSPLSAADIAAVAKDDDFGGGWMWIIVLFLFMYGNGWNRGNGTEATEPSQSPRPAFATP